VAFQYTQVSGSYTNAITVAATPGIVTGMLDTPVSAVISGLAPGTFYYYRVVANNGASTATGDERSFRTSASTKQEHRLYLALGLR
jgi:phosphodiesterase/alkaline phosphatase D-like protein